MQCVAKNEKSDCWFTRYHNFKFEQSDWPREGEKVDQNGILVNSPFRNHKNVTRCTKSEKLDHWFMIYFDFKI